MENKLNPTSFNEQEKFDYLIKKKLSALNHTRHNRIFASKRLQSYDDTWSILTVVINMMAILFIIFSFALHSSRALSVESAVFSCYAIILQYFLSTRDYNTRSLKLHYQQLEIEDLRNELQQLQAFPNSDISANYTKLQDITAKYQTSLKGAENHTSLDNRRYIATQVAKEQNKEQNNKEITARHIWDKTGDQLFIYANALVLILMMYLIAQLYL